MIKLMRKILCLVVIQIFIVSNLSYGLAISPQIRLDGIAKCLSFIKKNIDASKGDECVISLMGVIKSWKYLYHKLNKGNINIEELNDESFFVRRQKILDLLEVLKLADDINRKFSGKVETIKLKKVHDLIAAQGKNQDVLNGQKALFNFVIFNFKKALYDDNHYVRREAIIALGILGELDNSAMPILIKMFGEEKDITIRYRIRDTLSKMSSISAIPYLLANIDHKKVWVREEVKDQLLLIDKKILITELQKIIRKEEITIQIKMNSASMLIDLKNKLWVVTDFLIKQSLSKNEQALNLLLKMNPVTIVSQFKTILLDKNKNFDIRSKALEILAQYFMQETQIKKFLISYLKDEQFGGKVEEILLDRADRLILELLDVLDENTISVIRRRKIVKKLIGLESVQNQEEILWELIQRCQDFNRINTCRYSIKILEKFDKDILIENQEMIAICLQGILESVEDQYIRKSVLDIFKKIGKPVVDTLEKFSMDLQKENNSVNNSLIDSLQDLIYEIFNEEEKAINIALTLQRTPNIVEIRASSLIASLENETIGNKIIYKYSKNKDLNLKQMVVGLYNANNSLNKFISSNIEYKQGYPATICENTVIGTKGIVTASKPYLAFAENWAKGKEDRLKAVSVDLFVDTLQASLCLTPGSKYSKIYDDKIDVEEREDLINKLELHTLVAVIANTDKNLLDLHLELFEAYKKELGELIDLEEEKNWDMRFASMGKSISLIKSLMDDKAKQKGFFAQENDILNFEVVGIQDIDKETSYFNNVIYLRSA